MRRLLIILAGVTLGSLALPANAFANSSPATHAAASNLIKNGSFEKPVVPSASYEGFSTGQRFHHWTVTGASGNVAVVSGTFTQDGFSFPAQAGNQWLDLTGVSNTATGVTQSIPTVSGATYILSFWVGNVYDPGGIFGTTSTVDVSVDGTQIKAATNSKMGTTQMWKKFKVHFTATSTSTSISFLNGDPSNDTNNGLDAISVTRQG
jgi:hypothetical protein